MITFLSRKEILRVFQQLNHAVHRMAANQDKEGKVQDCDNVF